LSGFLHEIGFSGRRADAVYASVINGIKPLDYENVGRKKDIPFQFSKFAIIEGITIEKKGSAGRPSVIL
jgi:hypothetical protein